jgi:two-component system, response regulator RegA
MKLGATHYLAKPADADQILAALGAGPPTAGAPSDAGEPPMSLARVEWEHIQRVLAEAGGNVSEAARRLGIHRRSLQRKLGRFPPHR